MELIRRKILIESLTSRQPGDDYGKVTGDSIYIKVMLTQNIDDMGMFTDYDYIPLNCVSHEYDINHTYDTNGKTVDTTFTDSTSISLEKPMTVEDYFSSINPMVTGYTDSKLTAYKTYNRVTPYNTAFIANSGAYTNYEGDDINGISKITSLSGPTGYTVDANDDVYIGTDKQSAGILYEDYTKTRLIYKQDVISGNVTIPVTTFKIKSEGWNETNVSLSALTKEEVYLYITSPPEIQSDVNIDRGVTTVFEPHLRLAEVESIGHLEMYGNGYYNIIK